MPIRCDRSPACEISDIPALLTDILPSWQNLSRDVAQFRRLVYMTGSIVQIRINRIAKTAFEGMGQGWPGILTRMASAIEGEAL